MSGTFRDKLCHACGADCTGRPRVRSRRGHYYCETCFELERGKGPDGALIADLVDEESKVVRTCPSCAEPMDRDTIVCTACGYNKAKATGGTTEPAVEFVRPPAPRDPVWHVRVGAISAVLGAGGVLAGLAGVAGVVLAGAEQRVVVLPVAVLLLALWLLSAGIGLTKRRVRAAISIRRWATVKVVLAIAGLAAAVAAVREGGDPTTFLADWLGLGGASVDSGTFVLLVLLAAIWSSAWPIVVLACLGRRVAQEDVDAW